MRVHPMSVDGPVVLLSLLLMAAGCSVPSEPGLGLTPTGPRLTTPSLSLSGDSAVIDPQAAWVNGKAESDAIVTNVTVLVGGRQVPVVGKADWLFAADSLAPLAWNTVVITATDTAGDSARDTLFLFRKPPLDSLRGLHFTDVGGTEIGLAWQPVTHCGRYVIDRCDSATTWKTAAAIGDTAFIDTGLLPGTLHRYRVRGYYTLAVGRTISDSTHFSRIDSARTMMVFQRVFGGSEDDYGRCVRLTKNGGYLAAGGSTSFGTGPAQGYVIHLGNSGDTVWSTLVNNAATNSALALAGGGFAACGTGTWSCGGCPPGSSLALAAIDSGGNAGPARTYQLMTFTTGMSVAQAHNGNLVACGTVTSLQNSGIRFAFWSELTPAGDTVWTMPKLDWSNYGTDTNVQVLLKSGATEGNAVVAVAGGYVVAGRWMYDPMMVGGGVHADKMCVIMAGLQGQRLWTDTLGGVKYACAYAADATNDGACIVAGETAVNVAGADTNIVVTKVNLDGSVAWSREIGSPTRTESARSIRSTPDGGFIVTGRASSPAAGSDLYLVKMTSLGDTVWTRTFGGSGEECGYSVDIAADGGFVVAGETTSFGSGKKDLYVIKTDTRGRSVARPR